MINTLALPHAYSVVEKANLAALSVSLEFTDLYDEFAILQRLMYKNNNQHRASKHFQSTYQVVKVLRLLQQLKLPQQVHQLHAAALRTSLPETAASASVARKRCAKRDAMNAMNHTQRQVLMLPTVDACRCVLQRLLSGAQLLVNLHDVILIASQHLAGQLSRGFFMPFCLVASGALARIRVLSTTALLELLQAYNSVMELLPLLLAVPIDTGSSDSFSTLLSSCSSLPQALQLAWKGPIPGLRHLPFDQDGPQSLPALAAGLQQTYCISAEHQANDSLPTSAPSVAALASGDTDSRGCDSGIPQHRTGMTSDWCNLQDLGVAISRTAFACQIDQQQHPSRANRLHAAPVSQQTLRAAPPTASFCVVLEDKQPQQQRVREAAAASAGGSVSAVQPERPPLYTAVPGLGLSLTQRHSLGPAVPVLLGADGAATPAATPGGLPCDGPNTTRQAQTANAASVAAMDVDGDAAIESVGFVELYGSKPASSQLPEQQLQQRHSAAAPRHTVRQQKSLQASAAMLAMQGSCSSDEDDDVCGKARAAMMYAGAALLQTAVGAAPADGALSVLQPAQARPRSQQQVPAQQLGQAVHPQQPQLEQQHHLPPAQAPSVTALQATAVLQGSLPTSVLPAAEAAQDVSMAMQVASRSAAAAAQPEMGAAGPPSGCGAAEGLPGTVSSLPALLLATKKKKQRRPSSKEGPTAGTDAASNAPSDPILNMLLQGLP